MREDQISLVQVARQVLGLDPRPVKTKELPEDFAFWLKEETKEIANND